MSRSRMARAGPDMRCCRRPLGGGPDKKTPPSPFVRLAFAGWEWWQLLWRRQDAGCQARQSPKETTLARGTIPYTQRRLVCIWIATTPIPRGKAKGVSDALFMDYRGYVAEASPARTSFRKGRRSAHAAGHCFLHGLTTRQDRDRGCSKDKGPDRA